MPAIIRGFTPALDGSAVTVGVPGRAHMFSIPAGAYATPFWINVVGGSIVRVDTLPWHGVLYAPGAGAWQVRIQSTLGGTPTTRIITPAQALVRAPLVTASVTGEPPSGDWRANEPGGYVTITDNDHSVIPGGGWWGPFGATEISVVADGIPGGDNASARITFPAGFDGQSPGVIGHTFTGVPNLYICIGHKLSANWEGHNSSINKVLFATQSAGGEPFLLNASTIGFGSTYFYHGERVGSDPGSILITNNLTTVSITKGSWAVVEMIIRGGTPGSANGEFHLWVNGTKQAQYTSFQWEDASATGLFDDVKYEPVWGGVDQNVTNTMFMYLDRTYVSGVN